VAIGLAVESGSRAWGFPSPDRDYDCRFVFIRPLAHYLTPRPRRDVIELPLVDELDVNGWDLAKSLKFLMKGNAVIIEWLTSPLVYRGDEEFCSSFLALARAVADRNLVIRHHLHLSEGGHHRPSFGAQSYDTRARHRPAPAPARRFHR
jgi:predicted nucleotidyltransferase